MSSQPCADNPAWSGDQIVACMNAQSQVDINHTIPMPLTGSSWPAFNQYFEAGGWIGAAVFLAVVMWVVLAADRRGGLWGAWAFIPGVVAGILAWIVTAFLWPLVLLVGGAAIAARIFRNIVPAPVYVSAKRTFTPYPEDWEHKAPPAPSRHPLRRR